MKLAVIGATGMVGGVMLDVLKERHFPYDELILVASESSAGRQISYNGKSHTVVGLKTALSLRPNLALFSAGGATSLVWAPQFAKAGCTVIDNSSAWRMHPDCPLVIPEINANAITASDKIIANPNCSTIQMLMVLAPLHKKYGLKRVVVSTYQSVTGTGVKAVRQLENEYKGLDGERAYKYQIHQNAIPQIDDFEANGYTKEEMKMTRETVKILADASVKVTATAVRLPIMGGHSESVNLSFERDFDLAEVKQLLSETPGVLLMDNPSAFEYPMPLFAHNKDEVFVGRIRRDESLENALNLWIVADNLRKGAATNAVQIAEYLYHHKLL